jgi:hypothetical protein
MKKSNYIILYIVPFFPSTHVVKNECIFFHINYLHQNGKTKTLHYNNGILIDDCKVIYC